MAKWLLLHYKIPTEPSASRVYIWRKLKRLGALLIQDAVWVLPDTPRNLEQFQWLSAEIVELAGEATLWSAQPAFTGQD
ncbi:MAG TPA: Chromate resistance protein ChrB, partial [Anaerolineales bacterium]|nr:Chromate resistance protein ChrB [Anaerolineales bacterium]